jgi:hypothetical protein
MQSMGSTIIKMEDSVITYKDLSQPGKIHIAVLLEGRVVGHISRHTPSQRFWYQPKGKHIAGAQLYNTLAECKRTLEAE